MKNAEALLKNGHDFTQLRIEPYRRVSANKVSYKIYIGNKCIDTITIKHTSSTNVMLVWLNMEYDPKILDDIEKKYLRGIINPFKKRAVFVRKDCHKGLDGGRYEQIVIRVKSAMPNSFADIELPFFKEGTMYKGMKIYKEYTMKELGL